MAYRKGFICMIISLCSFALAVATYCISQLAIQSKLRGQKGDASFWGERSWLRKYSTILQPPLENWYYRRFKIGFKERFLGSATIFVLVTDSYHFCQFLFTILFCISAVSYEREFGFWWDLLVYYAVWHCVFPITYKVFGK